MTQPLDPPTPLGVRPRPIGMMWLLMTYAISVPAPCVASYVVDSGAGVSDVPGARTTSYPSSKEPGDLRGHLRFALKYEPIHYGLWAPVLRAIGPEPILAWIRDQPFGQYARKAWYLYELLTGDHLDHPDLEAGNYVPLLNSDTHITAFPRSMRRQRIEDNALGWAGYCPLVRRTQTIREWLEQDLAREVSEAVADVPPELLARVLRYLTAKETRASFEIESEKPSSGKEERFAAALFQVGEFPVHSETALARLQNIIVEPRYAEQGFRTDQNYVASGYGRNTTVHLVPPRPEDIQDLMKAWFSSYRRVRGLPPVCGAAVAGFGFVFIHPFGDGNGRIHRFIFQRVLAESRFSPAGVLTPISAAIVRDPSGYDAALESFSRRIAPFVDYTLDERGEMKVWNDTGDLYRFWDATVTVEYLFRVTATSIREDLVREIGYLRDYDRAMERLAGIVDMPNKRAALLIGLIFQNGGRLARRKREQFPELTDAEIERIESAITRTDDEASLFGDEATEDRA